MIWGAAAGGACVSPRDLPADAHTPHPARALRTSRYYWMTNERITGLYHGGRQIGDASGDSGIAHHIPVKKAVLDDLRAHVETLHGETFWKAILGQISLEDPGKLAFSEVSSTARAMRTREG